MFDQANSSLSMAPLGRRERHAELMYHNLVAGCFALFPSNTEFSPKKIASKVTFIDFYGDFYDDLGERGKTCSVDVSLLGCWMLCSISIQH